MKKKILLIDDEKDFTSLTGTVLHFHDLDVDTVNNPLRLDEAFFKNQYALVVTDLMMPQMDGFKLIEKVRKIDSYKKTPIIALSAKALSDKERKFLFQNRVHFFGKPFEPQGFVKQIKLLLS